MESRPKRGLSALLASTAEVVPTDGAGPAIAPSILNADIGLLSIRPNASQPRTHFDPDKLNELAASIKARGLIQPLVVRELRSDEVVDGVRYELIAGERRWRASQIAGLTAVPAVIKQVFDQREILLLSLVENLQRDDLNPLEEAIAFDRLAKLFNLTHEQIAEGVGKNRATVSNAIRLLELPSTVQDAIKCRKLSISHAKVLLTIPDAQIQAQLAAKIQAENLTIKDLEHLIAWENSQVSQGVPLRSGDKGTRHTRSAPAHLQEIERQLREHFGTRVFVDEGLRKGRIVVEFYSVEDFQRVIALMGVSP